MLKNDAKFLTAIRLLRMNSAIITVLSFINRVIKEDSTTKRDERDRYEEILYYGAVLYESIKTLGKMNDKIRGLKEYKQHIDDINYLTSELKNKNSFIYTILGTIRDKLVFHFDEESIQESLSELDIADEELIILEGDSEKSVDVNYPVVAEVYLNYLIKKIPRCSSDKEKLKYILIEMNTISSKIGKIVGDIAGELLKNAGVHLKEDD